MYVPGRRVRSFILLVRYFRKKGHVAIMYLFHYLIILVFGIYVVYRWSMVYHGKPTVYQNKKMENHWYDTHMAVLHRYRTI